MSTQKGSFPHIFKHVPSGKWLELWIDGWYLVDDMNEATRHFDEQETSEKLIPRLTELFRGDKLEVIFLEPVKTSSAALQTAMA